MSNRIQKLVIECEDMSVRTAHHTSGIIVEMENVSPMFIEQIEAEEMGEHLHLEDTVRDMIDRHEIKDIIKYMDLDDLFEAISETYEDSVIADLFMSKGSM